MKRVLYLLNHAGKAGTERYVETLVRYLNHNQIEAFFAYNESGLLVERMEAMGVPTCRIEMNSRFDRKAAKALAELCIRWKIDVIHCHYLRENYIAMLSKSWYPRVRVVYTNHFILANDFITRVSNKMLDKKQDQMIAVCNRGREQLIQNGWSPEKIQVIFNAVDPQAWQEPMESTLRQEIGVGPETFVMLCASRFAHDKGHPYLIDSLALLKQRTQKPFCMVLAGDGDLLGSARQQVERLNLTGEVKFLGFRKDIKNLYKGSDLYVNSSEHEALSFLIIEAMAAGLPVIATDMGGNRDIVNPESHCGLLVEYNNPDSMARAMQRMMEEPELLSACREGALRTIEEKFNVHKMVKVTYNVYLKACGESEEPL